MPNCSRSRHTLPKILIATIRKIPARLAKKVLLRSGGAVGLTTGVAPTGIEQTRQERLPVYAGMASIPTREKALERAVSSVYDQVDHLFIYLNNYKEAPAFLARPKISVFKSDDLGDIKDTGKFYGLTKVDRGIYLSLDDDIEYPADYVRVMTAYLAKFKYRCVVGVHGIVLPTLAHSFFDRKVLHFEKGLSMTVPVSILGTGTTAFSIADTGIEFALFRHHGMADISLAIYLKQKDIPALALKREDGWLRSLCDRDELTLYRNTRRHSVGHTELIVRNRPWGFDDLIERIDRAGLSEALPGRWRALVAARNDEPNATEQLSQYPLAMMHDAARALLNPCEIWRVAKAFRPTRKQDPRLHAKMLQEATAYYPDEVVDTAKALYLQAEREDRHDAMVEYGGAWMTALTRLSLSEEADALYSRMTHSGTVSSTAAMEYLRLKSQQGDFRTVLSLIEEHYGALQEFSDFTGHFFQALAKIEGTEAAVQILFPSFMSDGRQALRARRSALSVLAKHSFGMVTARKPYLLTIAERTAIKHGKAARIHDLALLYVLLGDARAAGWLLAKGRKPLKDELGRPIYALLRALTTESPRATIRWINAYNSLSGLSKLRLSRRVGPEEPFLPALQAAQRPPSVPSKGRVSVIMAAFNSRDTVEYAARSILEQTYADIELILVDDASSDGTADVLEQLRRADERVVVIRNAENVGPYACRNIALEAATGDFVAIQDADDFAHPERIARQFNAFDRADVVASYARHVRVQWTGQLALENNGAILGDGPVTLLCRREVFRDTGPFEAVRTRGDIEFRDRLKCFYGSHRLAHLTEVLVYALHDTRSNSHTMLATAEAKRNLARFRAAYNRKLMLARCVEDLRPELTPLDSVPDSLPGAERDQLIPKLALHGIEN